mmetsp:Transcript_20554/g.32721  ORF Transcript_20554/g.32721 Transcript_20554/m.32721 type:complete len:289 (+) Transcript_20554:22-888(+)
MSLTVEQYNKLDESEQKKAMKEIEAKIKSLQQTLDKEFEQYINNEIPAKIIELNGMSRKVPTLFHETPPIKVNILHTDVAATHQQTASKNAKNSNTAPPRKRRRLNPNKEDNDEDDTQIHTGVWYSKTPRTLSELSRLETSVAINESMNSISNLIDREIIQIIDIVTSMKMSISLKIPAIQEGLNFGVEIQEEMVDDLGRAENGALDAIEQISNYYQIRSKAISKILKWPYLQDYRDALQEFDKSHAATLKSMVVDLRNSYMILHDTLTKNMEKIKNPRDQRSKFYMY